MNHETSSKPARVLVTGATGFVGRYVVAALASRGHKVVAMGHRNEVPCMVSAKCVDVLSGDVCDPEVQRRAVRDVDAVCHLAAHIPGDFDNVREVEKCYRVNALATFGLSLAAVEEGVERFVYVSSGNMYVHSDKPATEGDLVYPVEKATYYFASKLAGELYLAHVCQRATMKSVTLRIGTPYGPDEPEQNVVANFMERAARGEELPVLYGGTPMYNFVHVEDVACCVARAAETGQPGIYNVASGEHTSVRDLAKAVATIHQDREVAVHIDPLLGDLRAGFRAMSIEKARHMWDFAPLNLLEGLRQYRMTLNGRTGQP